jgi:3-oxoacyl-[acyl-carrier protein] reductase
VALVTGGGSGLGGYILPALARAGCDVVVAYNSGRERAEAAAALVTAAGRRAHLTQIDVTDEASVNAGVAAAAAAMGGLDILINNAGSSSPAVPFEEFDAAGWDGMMAINVKGPFLMAKAAAPHLRASGRGRIVNLGSVVGTVPSVSPFSFTVSKAAVVPLTRYLAAALAPDVLVNCVAPGLMEDTLMSGGMSDEGKRSWYDRAVLGRSASHADVAAQILRFCEVDSVTGQTTYVDGGINFH